ncbi:general transcription factor II-I repeat domain-containing protein 2A-like, partial [Physella acuta]|uniref:general transcription factor II-I repeat domain-containing protein 2A-like n=1 Tax=Physella acuta TaxID=109671 RepID=UPI0027DE6F62
MKKIKDLPLSAKTVQDRTSKMSSNITHMHVENIQSASATSLAMDESCDIRDTAHVTLFARYISSQGPKEELLGLLPLSGQTRGEDIADAVQNCLEDYDIDINKIVSIATDEARIMTGIHNGVTTILRQKINREILTFHCIVHQEALCARTFPTEMVEVMDLVIKISNSILAKALYHRKSKEFLEELESHYSDLLMYNKVLWLSKDLRTKHLWSDKFTELKSKLEELEVQKSMHVKLHKWTSLKEMPRVETL